jgi:hypothetical protein
MPASQLENPQAFGNKKPVLTDQQPGIERTGPARDGPEFRCKIQGLHAFCSVCFFSLDHVLPNMELPYMSCILPKYATIFL